MDFFRWGVNPGPPNDVEESISAHAPRTVSRSVSMKSFTALAGSRSKESLPDLSTYSAVDSLQGATLGQGTDSTYLHKNAASSAVSSSAIRNALVAIATNADADELDNLAELSHTLRRSSGTTAKSAHLGFKERFVVFHENHLQPDYWNDLNASSQFIVLKSARGPGGEFFCFDQKVSGVDQTQPVYMHDRAEWKLVAHYGRLNVPVWNDSVYLVSMPPKHRSHFFGIMWNVFKRAQEIFLIFPSLSLVNILQNVKLNNLAARLGEKLDSRDLENAVRLSDYGQRLDSLMLSGISNKITPMSSTGISYAAQFSSCVAQVAGELADDVRAALRSVWQESKVPGISGWEQKALCCKLVHNEYYVDEGRTLLQIILTLINYDSCNRHLLSEKRQWEEHFTDLINQGILTPIPYEGLPGPLQPRGLYESFLTALDSKFPYANTNLINQWVRRAPDIVREKVSSGCRDSKGQYTLEAKIKCYNASAALKARQLGELDPLYKDKVEELSKLMTNEEIVVGSSDCFDGREVMLTISDQVGSVIAYVSGDVSRYLGAGHPSTERFIRLAV
jgi:hypothetical protein